MASKPTLSPHDDIEYSGHSSSFFVEVSESFQQKQGYTWEELQRIEKDRRSILKRIDEPFWQILSHWDGTCLGVLSRDPLLWMSMALYVLIRLQAHFGNLPVYVEEVGEASDISILGTFLSFFLVFFVNQSNSRFNEMYKKTAEIRRRILDAAGVAAITLPPAQALRLVRYMNAAHAAGYVGLSVTYTQASFFDELNRSLGLLTPSEKAYIDQCDMDHRGDCFREITNWAMVHVRTAEKTDGVIEPRYSSLLYGRIMDFRTAMDNLYDYCDQPIHFFYIHFLCLLTSVYVPIFAISTAYSAGTGDQTHWSADVLYGLIVFMQAIFVIGLRLLGQKMMDPFGDDVEDLSVLKYIREAWKTSNRSLNANLPSPVSLETEEGIEYTSASLGYPWNMQRCKQTSDGKTDTVGSGVSGGFVKEKSSIDSDGSSSED